MTAPDKGPRASRALWLLAGLLTGAALTAGAIWAISSLGSSSPPTALGAPLLAEETSIAGVDHAYEGEFEFFVGGGVAVFDCDDDRRPELYVAGGTAPAGLYLNRTDVGGELSFAQLPSATTDLVGVTGAYPIDIDSDGLTDLAVLRRGENVVLRGEGDCAFEVANDVWGIEGGDAWTAAFSATWSGDDQLPTLAFGNYLAIVDNDEHLRCDDNQVLRPEDGGYGDPTPLSPGWCTLSILFSDWGDKGQVDLRMTNDRHYYVDGEEQLWDMSGTEPTEYGRDDGWKTMQIWGMGIASQDITGDGLPEVFLTSQGDNKLQTLAEGSSEPAYEDIALALGATAHRPFIGDTTRPSTAWHAEFDDVNNDGVIDLLVTKGNVDAQTDFAADDPNNLLIGQLDGTFVEGAEDAGFLDMERSRGAALSDLNLDGLLDVVVVERRSPVRLWRNTGSPGDGLAHWLAVDLDQAPPNRDAIGAWIEVRFGDTITRREMTIGGGHAGGELGWAHFGLGGADSAELRVIWPDGERSRWQAVTADQFLIVDRSMGSVTPWVPH